MDTVPNQLNTMSNQLTSSQAYYQLTEIKGYWDKVVSVDPTEDLTGYGILVRLASYGSYTTASLVNQSNSDILERDYEDCLTYSVGGNSQSIIILGSALLENRLGIRDTYESLQNYPILDEEHYTGLCETKYFEYWQDLSNKSAILDNLYDAIKPILSDSQFEYFEDWIDSNDWSNIAETVRSYHEKCYPSGDYYQDNTWESLTVKHRYQQLSHDDLAELVSELSELITLEQAVDQYNLEIPVDSDMVIMPKVLELWLVTCELPGCLPNYSSLHTSYESALDDGIQYIDPNHDLDQDKVRSILDQMRSYQFDDGTYLGIERLTYLPT